MQQHLSDGTTLQSGKYVINGYISAGGFGCTYRGTHTGLDIKIAIKEFFVADYCERDMATGDVSLVSESRRGLYEKLKSKFLSEARALARMHHDGIVKVYDVFAENGTAYYVMDYIDGLTLRDMVTQYGPMEERTAIAYIAKAAQALSYVHSINRLHLDIKPANIMVDGKGKVYLIDFGVSKQYDEVDGQNTSTLMGQTPGYAAIEQMSNDVSLFTPATDIYSLGATLYYLLTGITPVPATSRAAGKEIAALPASVSPRVRKAVMAALSLSRRERPATVEAFMGMLTAPSPTPSTREQTVPLSPKVSTPTQPKPKQSSKSSESYPSPEYDNITRTTPKPSIIALIVCAAIVVIGGCILLFSNSGKSNDTISIAADTTTIEQQDSSKVTKTVNDGSTGSPSGSTAITTPDGKTKPVSGKSPAPSPQRSTGSSAPQNARNTSSSSETNGVGTSPQTKEPPQVRGNTSGPKVASSRNEFHPNLDPDKDY